MKPKTYKLYEGREDNFQKALATVLDLKGFLWYHVANERGSKTFKNKAGQTFSAEGRELKAKGVKPGVSDVIIMEPKGSYHGLVIELKTKSNKLSEYQLDFLRRSDAKGYFSFVTWAIDEAITCINTYMNLTKGAYMHMRPGPYVNSKGNIYEYDKGKISCVKRL